jgi:hypothetical protein
MWSLSYCGPGDAAPRSMGNNGMHCRSQRPEAPLSRQERVTGGDAPPAEFNVSPERTVPRRGWPSRLVRWGTAGHGTVQIGVISSEPL